MPIMPHSIREVSRSVAPSMRQFTLSVRLRGLRWFRYRAWLATQWCRLGAWIIGCRFIFDSKEDNN